MGIIARCQNILLFSIIKALSTFGSILTTFTTYVLLYNFSHISLIVGLGGIIYALSPSLLSSYLGATVDRIGAKKSLLMSVIFNIIILFFILLWYRYWMLLLMLIFFYSAFTTLNGIAFNALIPTVVDKEELFRFNSFLSFLFMISGFPAPIFAGYLVRVNIQLIFLIDILTYLVEMLMIIKIKEDAKYKTEKTSILKDLRSAFSYIKMKKDFLLFFLSIFIAFLLVGGLKAVLIPYFSDIFSQNYGFYFGVYNSFDDLISGLILLLFTLGYIKFERHLSATFGGILFYFVSLAILSFFISFPVVILASSISGFSSGLISPNSATYLQKNAELQYIGRIFGIQQFTISLATLISYLSLGTLSTIYDAGDVLRILAITGLTIFGIIFAVSVKLDARN